jgi:hypothetical protein
MNGTEQSEFSKIGVLENIIEAQVVESILLEQAIPHRIRSFYDTAYDGLFQLQKGWGEIYAPPSYHEEIREIIHAIRSQNSNLPREVQ